MHVWPLYGLALLSSVGLARYGQSEPRSEETLGVALVLSAQWVMWNLCHWFMPHPYNQLFPAADGLLCVGLAWLWRWRYSPWRVALILCLFGDCVLHAIYANTTWLTKWMYDADQNALWIVQLTCVSHIGLRKALRLWRRLFMEPSSRIRGNRRCTGA